MSNVLNRDDLLLAHELAEDIIALGSSASLDRSPKKNWVENAGELPAYVREVARSIEKTGKTLSQAIAIAISRIKKWAATGKGEVKAKAIKALAEWEALKAKNKGKKGKDKAKMSHIEKVCEEAVVLELTAAVTSDFFYLSDTRSYEEPTNLFFRTKE